MRRIPELAVGPKREPALLFPKPLFSGLDEGLTREKKPGNGEPGEEKKRRRGLTETSFGVNVRSFSGPLLPFRYFLGSKMGFLDLFRPETEEFPIDSSALITCG